MLASQSPRRRQILTISGYDFDILPSQISEIPNENLNLTSQIRQLASDKAHGCLKMGKLLKGQGFLILAADTVVALDGQILGKPKDEKEARSFLRRLSGQTHDVITAVSLLDVDTGWEKADHAVTRVRFRELDEKEIEAYVASGDPFDKAGGYGIQGEASKFVAAIDGAYDCVVGLSMATVESLLADILADEGVTVAKRSSAIAGNLGRIRQKIAHASQERKNSAVKLVAVSKMKSALEVLQAWQAGQYVFGENYVQEALPKIEEVARFLEEARFLDVSSGARTSSSETEPPSPQWHFIGALQSKKVKQVVGAFDLIHSVDRVSLVEEIEKRAAERGIVQSCLLQINIAAEESKSGASREEFMGLLRAAAECKHIRLCGVMAMPPLVEDERLARQRFAEVREVFEAARLWLKEEAQKDSQNVNSDPRDAFFREISMGTTQDFAWAIREGATIVRIGTAIFGERA